MFCPLEGGGVNWPGISFYFGMAICTTKAEKIREFVQAQSEVQRQKVQLKFEGMQLKEAVSLHWATVILHCTQNTWCIF